MADPDLTPEALKRLCERLRDQTSNEDSAALEDEAAAAISVLMAERDALTKRLADRVSDGNLSLIERAEQAEAKLREIVELLPRCPVTELRIRIATIARSTSQGGEG